MGCRALEDKDTKRRGHKNSNVPLVHPLFHPFQHRFAEHRNLPLTSPVRAMSLVAASGAVWRWSAGIAWTGRSAISSNKWRCSSVRTKDMDRPPRAERD
jgi:hypothetical protein